MLWILVPIVISYLRDSSELALAPAYVKALHEFALQWLTRVGPKYPQVMNGKITIVNNFILLVSQ